GANTVGLRFVNVGLPPGATITSAAVQFTASSSDAAATSLFIVGQSDTNALTFTDTNNDITDRPRTLPSVPWTPPAWIAKDAGPAERTPDLSALLDELVHFDGWRSTSPVVLRFDVGTGQRRPVEF